MDSNILDRIILVLLRVITTKIISVLLALFLLVNESDYTGFVLF